MACSEFSAAEFLESRGWLKEIAQNDFDLGVRIVDTLRNGDPKMGLILSGDYGSGKTAFVRALFKGFPFFAMPQKEAVLSPDFTISLPDIILDDIGAEHSVNEYGVHKEEFADFVVRWHAQWERGEKGRLIITTNLKEHEFERRYGGRVVSRLKDLCYTARFQGADKRTWKVIK